MSARAVHLVIDARPRGPRGLLAAELVLGRSVLDHLLEVAVELATPSEPVVVHARADDHHQLRELAGKPAPRRHRVHERTAACRCQRPADGLLL